MKKAQKALKNQHWVFLVQQHRLTASTSTLTEFQKQSSPMSKHNFFPCTVRRWRPLMLRWQPLVPHFSLQTFFPVLVRVYRTCLWQYKFGDTHTLPLNSNPSVLRSAPVWHDSDLDFSAVSVGASKSYSHQRWVKFTGPLHAGSYQILLAYTRSCYDTYRWQAGLVSPSIRSSSASRTRYT